MQKIRTKAKCPCGSGKKYKNCCMPKDNSSLRLEGLSKYQLSGLLSKLAYLQLNPNHPAMVPRVQAVINFIASAKKSGDAKANLHFLQKFIETNNETNLPPGDCANSLFCTRFPFQGTNYHVYPDSIVDETKSLQILLDALSRLEDNDSLIQKCFKVVQVLLSISDSIANDLSHYGNIPYADDPSNVSDKSSALVFSEIDLKERLRLLELPYEDFKSFIIEINEEISSSWEENHVFYSRPILKIDSQYIVVYPKSMLSAIRHFIILEVKRANVLNQLLSIITELTKQEIEILCERVGYKRHTTDLDISLQSNEILLEFDIDKICYIYLVGDDCTDYDPQKPYIDSSHQTDITSEIEERRNYLIDNLLNKKYSETLSLLVNVGVGRSCSVMPVFAEKPDKHYVCVLAYRELITYLKKTNINELSLYKLTKSVIVLNSNNFLRPLFSDFLDVVAVYERHKQSFNFSDEKVIMMILPGEGVNQVKDSVCQYDLQYTDYYRPNQRILVEKLEPYLDEALYVPSSFVGWRQRQALLVKCYKKNLWISFKNVEREEFMAGKVLASWLLHLKIHLETFINQFNRPILFHINVNEMNSDDIQVLIEDNSINIQLAKQLFEREWDGNEFEQLLISAVLRKFVVLCRTQSVDITQEIIDEIIRTEIPAGEKKFLQFFHSHSNPQLINLFMEEQRVIESCDIEKQLDSLGVKVQNKLPHLSLKTTIPKKERKIFVETIQEIFLNQIKMAICEHDTKNLLENLLTINELIVQQRAFRNSTGASSAYCFSSVEQRARELSGIEKEMTGIAVGVRFLIEFIIATDIKSRGNPISKNSLDELVASGYHYVNWGFIGQSINCNIADTDFQILNSGRVGNKTDLEPILDAYRDNKSLESLESHIEKESPKELEDALLQSFRQGFQEEFGLSVEKYLDIFSVLINYAISQKKDIVTMPKFDLIKIIKESVQTNEDEINAFIDNFSLSSRGEWDSIPTGFNKNEIYPWVYKRRLSLNKKPLLVLPKEEEILIMYGFRQCCEIMQLFLSDLKSANVNRGHYNSKSLSKFFGAIEKKQGAKFEMKAFDWFQDNKRDSWEVKRKICIGPNELLRDDENLGDVDIFIINKTRKKIYACECKDLSSSRNPAEVANEIERLTDDSRKKSYSTLHMNRVYWLRDNFDQVKQSFSLKDGRWEIIPWMIFSRSIPTTLIKQLPSATTSLYELKREGIKIIENKGKQYRIKIGNTISATALQK